MNILRERCTGCAYCVLACPLLAIATDGYASIDEAACTECSLCLDVCPNDAIEGTPLPHRRDYGHRYEIVVIGAGIGGLMAAAALARAGRQIAVFEQLAFIGGRYTEIEHRGYLVTTGAWTPPGRKSNIGRFLDRVGAEVQWITLRDKRGDLARLRFPDGRHYPAAIDLLSGTERRAWARAIAEGRQNLPRGLSTRKYLSRFVGNADFLAAVDATVATASGIGADGFEASEYIQQVEDMRTAGSDFGYPVGGPRAIVDALAKVIQSSGGHIFTATEVARIVIENGRPTGVELEDGDVIRAETVVHNGGAGRFLKLVGREHLPRDYVAHLENLRPVDCAALVIGTREPVAEGAAMLLTPGAERVVGIFFPTFFDASVAPPGRHMLDAFFPLRSLDRRHELALALGDLRRLFPRLDEVAEVVVPMFFVGTWTGAECGQFIGQSGENRLDPRTPIEGLYLVGMDLKGSGLAGDEIPIGVQRLLDNLIRDA
jgi:phytoene dehydrogenase-like protein/NAD-dependent dihydropyrimidine dehydrogenase PreA subunit